ncbi:MAG: ChbG/HpnK family deacetylase [Acidimicrobiia bacterium]|nr:ChbG/HpnK family deacetylase [Acidimicrobiia bacterium]
MTLITTADDFGWDDDTVAATIDLLERGVIRNASIMANVPATEAALAYAADHPQHGWGVHLTFTRDESESPLLSPDLVPDLVDDQGRFRAGRPAQIAAASGRFPVEQIVAEMTEQLRVVCDRGIAIDYVDSHKHLHKYPVFARALDEVLPQFGIHTVRRPQDRFAGARYRRPSAWLGPMLARRIRTRWQTSDHFFMADGDPDVAWWDEAPLSESTSLEIGCHPGRSVPWRDNERRGIEAVVDRWAVAGHHPQRWRDLTSVDSGV